MSSIPDIDHWNYRVVKRIIAEEEQFGVYEVYYNKSGELVACAENPMVVVGDSPTKAIWEVNLMITAFEKPTLNYDDIIGGGEDGDEE